MKKWVTVLILALLTAGLAGCGNAEETEEEVYANALEAADAMNSAEVEMEMKQEIEIPGEEEVIQMESNMGGPLVMDPIAMHQKGTMSINMGELTEGMMDVEQEFYMVDNEIYMFDSLSGQWMKMDDSMMPMELLNSNQMDASEQLSMYEEYVEDLSFEETDDGYLLSLTADAEGVTELTEELLEEMIPEELTAQLGEDAEEVLKNMKINQLLIEMLIDKDTYEMNQYNMEMDMTIVEANEEMNLIQEVKTAYKNINSIDTIEVPQDVMDSAVDGFGF
ncbi:DUF6612 family protein [Oceanobacillus salinisoli]|uniref:DUF6612 family protein n=1 Tax=Oceanobacillus salinisoli TaxID=2678611 RepID=UPI0012E13E58|nr:DUF6612 family protein [Oceanobacillus salinisoli]